MNKLKKQNKTGYHISNVMVDGDLTEAMVRVRVAADCPVRVGVVTAINVSVAMTVRGTLRASLSGTFLQTLPDLVTPLKGHSLSPRSCPATRSAPSERFGYRVLI